MLSAAMGRHGVWNREEGNRNMHRLLLMIAVMAMLATGSVATALAQDATPSAGGGMNAVGDPLVGTAVPYIGSDGNEIAKITVDEVIDPFEEYDPSFSPERGSRLVGVIVTVENTGTRPHEVNPFDFLIQDDQGFLYGDTFVALTEEAEAEYPELESDDLADGDSVTGFLAFEVLADTSLVQIFYSPESDRLITLADIRVTAGP
jgi:Domain of unknown function (DUF4352)